MRFIFIALISIALGSFSLSSRAFNNDSLWLPKRFEHFRPLLVSAALDLEVSERCAKVISGEMSRAHSTPSMPAFVVVCKDHNNRSYTTVVKKSTDELPKDEGEEGSDESEGGVINAASDGAVIDVLDSEKLRQALSGQALPEEDLIKKDLSEKEKVVTDTLVKEKVERVEVINTSINAKTQQVCEARLQAEVALFLQDVLVTKQTVVQSDNHEVQLSEFSGRLLASDETAVFVSRCYQYNAKRVNFSLKPV